MLSFLLKMVLVHVLGDFVLQPDGWIRHKAKHKLRSNRLYAHVLVHLLLFLLVFGFKPTYYWAALVMVVTHFVIDAAKLYLNRLDQPVLLFVGDQFLHFLVLVGLAYWYYPDEWSFAWLGSDRFVLVLIAVLLMTYGISIMVKNFLSRWSQRELELPKSSRKGTSLASAGLYIGMLERLFIFGFILLNQWSGIGFLLAAKSIFRFGDLTRGRDRKLTEYILIGTLLSFGLAMLGTLVFKWLWALV